MRRFLEVVLVGVCYTFLGIVSILTIATVVGLAFKLVGWWYCTIGLISSGC